MHLTYLQPLWWLLGLLVLGMAWRYSLVDRPPGKKLASLALRGLAVVFLVLALCRPGWMREADDLHVVFLVDVSQSVDLKASQEAVAEVEAAVRELKPGDSHSVFAMAKGVRLQPAPDLAKTLESWRSGGVPDDQFRSASRLAEAMLSTRLAFPAGKSRRLVLLSDGQETQGDVSAAVETLKREQVEVEWKPLAGLADPEASVVSVEPNTPGAFAGEIVRLKVRMASNQAMGGKLRILNQGVSVQEKAVSLAPGSGNEAVFDVPMNTPGASLWTAELIPDKDHFPLNNQAAATVQVKGKSRVLIVHRTPREMRAAARALEEQEFEVDVRGESGVPDTMDGLMAFDAIMLADIPATSIPLRQMQLLKSYVQDFGGGLAMMGSDNSFGLGGYYKTPVEDVLPLVSRFEKEKEKPSLAMVLIIDKSGSMQGAPMALARQAAKASVELLGAQDQVAVIAFDGAPQLVSEMRRASERDAIQAAIDTIQEAGGTDMYSAMEMGKQILENTTAKIKHMICLTDGQTEDRGFGALTQALVDSGVTVSTVGMGDGAAGDLLQGIAEVGKGRYYQTNDPANVPQIFTKETIQATKSAIKEDVYQAITVTEHPMLAGYADSDLPASLGYVMTEAKPTTQVVLAVETGDPLLAVGRFGLGQGLCFTSDLTEKWGGEWLAWDGCGKFWAQVLRSILKKTDVEGMDVRQSFAQDSWHIDIRRREPDGTPTSGLKWDARAVDANGKEVPVAVRETGLGRYTADVPLEGQEKLSLRLRDTDRNKLKVLSWTRPAPAEYRLGREAPASVTALPPFSPAEIRKNLTPVTTRQSLDPWCYGLALLSALGSVVLRRI